MPPGSSRWIVGKTVESIQFVRSAEIFIETSDNDIEKTILLAAITNIKSGQEVIDLAQTPQEYIIAFRQRNNLI